jgi:hypothetical protein
MRKSKWEWKEIAEEERVKRVEMEELCRKMNEKMDEREKKED